MDNTMSGIQVEKDNTEMQIISELSDEEELQVTPAQVIEMMEEAWINEKFGPEILPHKIDIVEIILSQISHISENLTNLENSDFKKSLHQMEVDRLRYLVSSYLRIRLEKIETYVYHILKEENERLEKSEDSYLTENELKFARNYRQALEEHFESVTSSIPRVLDDWKNYPITPNIHSFIFLKSKREIEGVVIDDGHNEDGDVVDLNRGSRMIISYNSVSNLIKNGDVQLI